MIQRGISRLYYCTTKVDWRIQTKQRLVPSKTYIEDCLATVNGWVPKTRWEVSDFYIIVVEDNKEFRSPSQVSKVGKEGKVEVDPIKHTTTSEP